MILTITISDQKTGLRIPGAVVTVNNAQGGQITQLNAGTAGMIQLDTDNDAPLLLPNNTLVIDAPGYYEGALSASDLSAATSITLTKKDFSRAYIMYAGLALFGLIIYYSNRQE